MLPSLDETNRYIFVTNYDGGSVCVLPINSDGSLGEPVDFVRHEGSSINPLRQEGPHSTPSSPDPETCMCTLLI